MSETGAIKEIEIVIGCLLCDSFKKLTQEEVKYNSRFGTTASVYICDECKRAIQWAKDEMHAQFSQNSH